MESKTNAPSFTVSLRGYDRMEVDEYLDSLGEALGHVEQAEERVHGLQAHVDRLNARVADLENKIRGETPRTGALLGERIAIVLRSAEEAAADTLSRAESEAAEIMEKAHQDVAAAEDQARGAVQRGEEQARRLEAAARAEAAEIIAEAESRASTRTRQIEQWADQVISHTRAEEARMLKELQDKRESGEAELRALTEQRDAVAASIAELREQLGHALGLVGSTQVAAAAGTAGAAGTTGTAGVAKALGDGSAEVDRLTAVNGTAAQPPAPGAAAAVAAGSEAPIEAVAATDDASEDAGEAGDTAEADADETPAVALRSGEADAGSDDTGSLDLGSVDDEMPWPSAFRPFDTETGPDSEPEPESAGRADESSESVPAGVAGGEVEEPDEFDTKFDAWMTNTGTPRHFRRL